MEVIAISGNNFRRASSRRQSRDPVTRRYLSRLRHSAVGRAHKHLPVTLLVAGRHARVVTEDGALIRELVIDPTRSHQPLGTLCGHPRSDAVT